MESLARFLVAVAELFEAEGLALKRQIVRVVVAIGLAALVLGLVVAGLCFLLLGLSRVLAMWLTPACVPLVLGVVVILLAWGILVYVKRLLKQATVVVPVSAHASLPGAGAALIAAGKAIDPRASMRSHPFTCVGVAAGVGVVLGMDRGRLIAATRLTRAISAFLRLVALAVGRYLVADAGRATTAVREEPAPEQPTTERFAQRSSVCS